MPSHPNWQNAVDLLVKRDERVDIMKLVNLLGTLPSDRAVYLAGVILKKIHSENLDEYPMGYRRNESIGAMFRCIPFVDDKERLQNEIGTIHMPHRFMMPGVVPTAIEFAKIYRGVGETLTLKSWRAYLIEACNGVCCKLLT